ncbi:AIM24 family protein [Streptomyces sp. NPDC002564]|uniref:AIM24 family protein n=1 Tax=Streptomyces sp. NPDC002564 TaxID=3364649 RepID=UPI00368183C0
MTVSGEGEARFASDAAHCLLVDVDDSHGFTVKAAGMAGGGLFNCTFFGTGRLALTSTGVPLVLPVTAQAPVYVDTDAVVAWSPQLKLEGDGTVVVNPGEPKPASTS